MHDRWPVTADRGFLMTPDPVVDPTPFVDQGRTGPLEPVLEVAGSLSDLMAQGRYRQVAEALPVPDFSDRAAISDWRALERLHQVYAFLANAYLWMPGAAPTQCLPRAIAAPFAALSDYVGRPPILSYANTQLANWRRRDPALPVTLDNIAAIQVFQDLPDEEWFWIVHTAIEAAGGPAVIAAGEAVQAAAEGDERRLEAALGVIGEGLDAILALARRIPEGCDPNTYFHTLRPFLFNHPDGVIFEGVERFGGRPQSFLGQTGAQSSLIPAICASLGIRHKESGLTEYLEAVRAYMPAAHRAYLAKLDGAKVRAMAAADRTRLRDLYNACIARVVEFRRFHLGLAARFIANKVDSPIGTGGTDFMKWLKHMTSETKDQLV